MSVSCLKFYKKTVKTEVMAVYVIFMIKSGTKGSQTMCLLKPHLLSEVASAALIMYNSRPI